MSIARPSAILTRLEEPLAISTGERERGSQRTWPADTCLVLLFLALTFLLGVFPVKDADFYWHLRTGDLIRQTGQIPRTDIFTFTSQPGTPWVNLHWIFEIAVSWIYQRGGVVGLNLAKCCVTTLALLLLVTARPRGSPIWALLLAWLPALLVLSGRMYVRPETLTLLYLSIFLAVLARWDRHPWLTWVLPFVQVVWVNSHGLFVLGPILLAFAVIDAALLPGSFAPERKKWWATIGIACVATVAACLINPYGFTGAALPLRLMGALRDPLFSYWIAECTPIPEFIRRSGWYNLRLQLYFATMLLGALSFLIPIIWVVRVRPSGLSFRDLFRSTAGWRLSPFRVLLYTAFCYLSFLATRNSHQFAAIVGWVTAANFGDWAAALARWRAAAGNSRENTVWASWKPRLVSGAVIGFLLLWVGSGSFFEMTHEERTLGLGEDPHYYPHEAVRFCGDQAMPDRFLSFPTAEASLYEYYHGPERKVFADPRLDVPLLARYVHLYQGIGADQPGWEAELDALGRPVVLVDHANAAHLGAVLLRNRHWRCVWFDPITAVFLHASSVPAARVPSVDFAARHFHPDRQDEPPGVASRIASAKAISNYLGSIPPERADLIRPLAWIGLDQARRVVQVDPGSGEGWQSLGQIEMLRSALPERAPRYRLPYDPVADLSMIRATYALRRGLENSPGDFTSLLLLDQAYETRFMYEAAIPVLEQLTRVRARNQNQEKLRPVAESALNEYRRGLGPPPPTTWQHLNEADEVVKVLLSLGRAESAADLLERAYPLDRVRWELLDQFATLRLHLGEPARARALWQRAASIHDSGVQEARIGATYLAEGDYEQARRAYEQALKINPKLFEASYSLAVLEQDAGNASAAYEHALKAVSASANDKARAAAEAIVRDLERFAGRAEDSLQGH